MRPAAVPRTGGGDGVRARPFRFGLEAQRLQPTSRAAWCDLARKVEALGFDTLLVDDHIGRQLAPLTALAVAAAATNQVRLGSFVFANDFRHPAQLAAEVASLDVLSEGRMEVGLGTGYAAEDYSQPGVTMDPPLVRIERLAEAVDLVKGFFTGEPVTFQGRYYTAQDLIGSPRPVQRPRPPLLLGGGGRRILSLAAREADIVSVNVRSRPGGGLDFTNMTAEATARKVAWVRAEAGERFPALELNILVPVVMVTGDPRRAAQSFIDMGRQRYGMRPGEVTVEQLLESPHCLIGTVEEMVARLRAVRERYGFSYIATWDSNLDAFAQVVERLTGT